MDKTIFAYYFLYKFIQQNVYIDILKIKDGAVLTGFWSRIIALILNLVHSSLTEHYFTSRTSRKTLLSVYASLLIILLYTSMQMDILEITFFTLNLTLCESIIFRDFLQLWQIQLCLELSILSNYISSCSISLYYGGIFVPIYILWIYSILLPHSRLTKRRLPTYVIHIRQCVTNTRVIHHRPKTIIYTILQVTLTVSYALIGCITIRNTIFGIFINAQFALMEVVFLMSIICLLVISACFLVDFNRKTKILLITILILLNYLVEFLIGNNTIKNKKYMFYINILMKKLLCMCKCCISPFLLNDYRKITYKGIRFRIVKFYILNADTISYVINMMINEMVDVNLLNIYIIIVIIIVYNLFIYF